ncbi:MAG: hypothetical protein RLZZ245_2312 [Verrucomicrobiota bacterium]
MDCDLFWEKDWESRFIRETQREPFAYLMPARKCSEFPTSAIAVSVEICKEKEHLTSWIILIISFFNFHGFLHDGVISRTTHSHGEISKLAFVEQLPRSFIFFVCPSTQLREIY